MLADAILHFVSRKEAKCAPQNPDIYSVQYVICVCEDK